MRMNKKECYISPLDTSDEKIVKVLKKIHGSTFEEDVDLPLEDLMWGLFDKKTKALVGYAAMGFSKHKDQAAFTACAIKKSYRGHGFQKRLIRHRIKEAKKMGIPRIVTHTVYNPPSENSLISCGFKLYRPRVEWAGEYANYWYKTLSA